MALHTPYDGTSKLFEIGLKPLDSAAWIEADEHLPAYLDEKARLLAAQRKEVFVAEAGTEAAQRELLELLVVHLTETFPQSYRRDGDAIEIEPAGRRVRLDEDAPLIAAARLVQEDLVLMLKGKAGWRVAAGAVCFPSSWRLADKAGRTMDVVHGPVPGFGAGSRPAELINRMFDHLRPAMPVIRWNWSLYGDDELFHPHDSPPRRFGPGVTAPNVFLRAERQTLRKLPVSGAIAFTIRILIDPLARLERHEDAARIAASLIAQLDGLNDAQLAYKGLTLDRERLIERLRRIA